MVRSPKPKTFWDFFFYDEGSEITPRTETSSSKAQILILSADWEENVSTLVAHFQIQLYKCPLWLWRRSVKSEKTTPVLS